MPRGREAAALAAILLIALILRVWNLPGESAWYDEVLTLACLDAPDFAAFTACCVELGDSTPLVSAPYRLVEYHWARLFGGGLPALRALSLCFGIAAIAAMHLLGRRLFGVCAGLLAATLLALALPHVFFSQEVRRYALECFLALLSFHLLFAARHPARGGAAIAAAWCVASLAVNGLLWLTSPFTMLLAPVQAAWLLAVGRSWSGLVAAWMLAHAAAGAAIVAALARGDHEHLYWLAPPGVRELVNTFVVFAGGRFSNDNPAPWLPGGLSLEFPLVVLFLVSPLAACLGLRRAGASSRREHALTLAALAGWMVVPVLFWFAYAHLREPVYLYRWVYFAALPLPLFAGATLQALPRRAGWAAAIAVVGLLAWQATVICRGPFRPDYAEAARRIGADPAARPALVLKQALNGLPLEYLGMVPAERVVYAHGGGDLHAQAVALGGAEAGAWVLLWRWDRMDALLAALDAAGIGHATHTLGGMPPLLLIEAAPRGNLPPDSDTIAPR